MGEYVRKIQVVGNRSYAVSLPKTWVLENNLQTKKNVNIHQSGANLILSCDAKRRDTSKVDIEIEDVDLLPNIVLLCYTKGVSELTLRFSKLNQYLKAKAKINGMLLCLEGFNITDEDESKIVINSLYTKSEINIPKIAKRMTSIINQMIDCIKNRESETKTILENELDSLYQLSKRTLYICSLDLGVRGENGIFDIEEIFLWRLIFKRLENIGDIVEIYDKNQNQNIVQIEEIVSNLNNIFIKNKKVDHKQIKSLKEKEIPDIKVYKINELVIDILNNYLQIELNRKYF